MKRERRKGSLLLMVCLMLTLFVQGFSQTDEVKLVEKLYDGTFIVLIGGIEYRALPPDKVRELIQLKENYEALQSQYDSLKKQFATYRDTENKQFEAFKAQTTAELNKAKDAEAFWKTEFGKENVLRLKFQKNLEHCSGKIFFWRFCTF